MCVFPIQHTIALATPRVYIESLYLSEAVANVWVQIRVGRRSAETFWGREQIVEDNFVIDVENKFEPDQILTVS